MTFDFYEVIDGLRESARSSDAGGPRASRHLAGYAATFWRRPTALEQDMTATIAFGSRSVTLGTAMLTSLSAVKRDYIPDKIVEVLEKVRGVPEDAEQQWDPADLRRSH